MNNQPKRTAKHMTTGARSLETAYSDDQPKPTGEWTADYVMYSLATMDKTCAEVIAVAHNAAIAAVIDKEITDIASVMDECQKLREQIAAEREGGHWRIISEQLKAELDAERTKHATDGQYLSGKEQQLREQLAAERERVRELEVWQASAMLVTPDYQAIGRALGLSLGESVWDKILPAIRNYQQEIDRLKDMITAYDTCAWER